MSNVPEEIQKTVTGVAEAMKENPSCFAAICLAAIFALLTYLSLTIERQEAHERAMALIEKCVPTWEKT
jgi:hypothetical protein